MPIIYSMLNKGPYLNPHQQKGKRVGAEIGGSYFEPMTKIHVKPERLTVAQMKFPKLRGLKYAANSRAFIVRTPTRRTPKL